MNVMLGQNAAAYDNVTFLLGTRIEQNTFYREGGAGSCTETPYAAAWAVTDWLMQSWNGTGLGNDTVSIDVFPGVDDVVSLATPYDAAPAVLANASFFNLRAVGAVMVSAARAVDVVNATHVVSRTAWVSVTPTLPAAPAPIVRTSLQRPLAVSPASASVTEIGDGRVVVNGVPTGTTATLWSAAAPPAGFIVAPAAACEADFNHWGTHACSGDAPVLTVNMTLQPCAYDAAGRLPANQSFWLNATSGQFQVSRGRVCLGRVSRARW
jgi:hypothetical protein